MLNLNISEFECYDSCFFFQLVAWRQNFELKTQIEFLFSDMFEFNSLVIGVQKQKKKLVEVALAISQIVIWEDIWVKARCFSL